MSLFQNIRAALQARAATAAGFPAAAQRAYEGVPFTATLGTTWARLVLIPASGRPYSLSAAKKQHTGLFQIDLFLPSNQGTGAAESLADAVRAVFEPGTVLTKNGERVFINYAERAQAITADPDWLQIPLTVSWRAFSTSN